ncbi:MAG: L,D-transpeptidase family protein [Proteobacteria bacterium]|nr:L,D-transpeptidase family protein [Pseudomonadota bacterium]
MKRMWVLSILALSMMACNGQTISTPSAASSQQGSNKAQTATNAEQDKRAGVETFVEKNADNLAKFAMKFASPPGVSNKIAYILQEASDQTPKKLKDYEDLAIPPLVHLSTLRTFYEARNHAPIFLEGTNIAQAAAPLAEVLNHLESHGITSKMIDPSVWQTARETMTEDSQAQTFEFNREEKAYLVDKILEENIDIAKPEAIRDMMTAIMRDKNAMPRLRSTVLELNETMKRKDKWLAMADVLMADLVMQFARQISFNNRTHLTEEDNQLLGKRPTEQKYAQIAIQRMTPWFESLIAAMDEGSAQEVETLTKRLMPPHPAYNLLRQGREKYAQMPDWPEVKSGSMTPGKPSKTAAKLRLRLSIEGYYGGDVSEEAQATPEFEIYDRPLSAAIRAYHETHQMDFDEAKGLQKDFWTSLNIPRAMRLAQIEENLRRWHQTQIVESPYYIFINVPDFHGEVWKDGTLRHRFPTVVGNAKRACDPTTKQWKYINATPAMHARMLYLEYNPYWHVPPRIEQAEYIKKINADPNWLKNNGFEYHTEGRHTILRQLPSDSNALGRVKFIFPNPHSVFLHDTPQKGLFRHPIRAFSYGCVRVWEPLKLARLLLELDGQWKDSIETLIEDRETRRYVFKNRFDVFIDYFTVRATDDGTVYFLADPYRYVRDVLEPPSAKSLECTPQPKAWIARTPGMGDEAGADTTTGIRD